MSDVSGTIFLYNNVLDNVIDIMWVTFLGLNVHFLIFEGKQQLEICFNCYQYKPNECINAHFSKIKQLDKLLSKWEKF